MTEFKVPLIIRGEVIEDYAVEFRDRGNGGHTFVTPSVEKYLHKLIAKSPLILEDLYTLDFDEICDYLDELRQRLDAVEKQRAASGRR